MEKGEFSRHLLNEETDAEWFILRKCSKQHQDWPPYWDSEMSFQQWPYSTLLTQSGWKFQRLVAVFQRLLPLRNHK